MKMETHVPRITIGVPVYNGEKYLATTLDSLLQQTFGDFIILIGDNASSDGTSEIAKRYQQQDKRIHYIRHAKNLGAAENYNHLFELAETEYFRWSAVDDPSEPRYLEACLEVLDRQPDVVLAYPKVMLIDSGGRPIREYDEGLHLPDDEASKRFLALLSNTDLCNAVYGLTRTEVLRQTGLMGSYIGSDIVFQAELALYGKFIEVPEILLLRRMHDESSTSMTDEELLDFYFPEQKYGAALYHWRHLREHIRSILRAPLSNAERLRLLTGIARRANWNRENLWREAKIAMGLAFGAKKL